MPNTLAGAPAIAPPGGEPGLAVGGFAPTLTHQSLHYNMGINVSGRRSGRHAPGTRDQSNAAKAAQAARVAAKAKAKDEAKAKAEAKGEAKPKATAKGEAKPNALACDFCGR